MSNHTPTPEPSEVAETTAGEREVRVTELLHAFDRSTGICRCGAGPFIAAEWLAHYRAQDQPVRVTTHEGEDAGEVEACYCGGVSACLPCQERDARDAAEPDAGEVEALTCKATSFGVPTDDHVTTCGASATEEWLDLTGQWVPVCDAHGRGRGVPDDRRRPLPAEREVEARQALLLALAHGDGQPWESIAEATQHTAEVMYGRQADSILASDWLAALLDRVRREEGERIAQAIETDCDHPASDQRHGCRGMRRAARIARAASVGRGEGP